MRIALLTATARQIGERELGASERYFGRSILSHQVDQALGAGCEMVVCLVEASGEIASECPNRAEAGGARLRFASDTRELAALIKPDDELIVIADGLLPDPDYLSEILARDVAIWTFPAEFAVPRGFERIDAHYAWAGISRLPGACLDALVELPPDAGAASALVRIALQRGLACSPIDPEILQDERWQIGLGKDSSRQRERAWIARNVALSDFAAPGTAVAQRMGVRLARDIVGQSAEKAPLAAAIGTGVAAALAGILGHPLVGFALLLLAAALVPVVEIVERVAQTGRKAARASKLISWLRAGVDLLLLGMIASVLIPAVEPGYLQVFVPAAMLAGLRLGERTGPLRLRPLLSDRIVLVLFLMIGALFGMVLPVTVLITVICWGLLLIPDITAD